MILFFSPLKEIGLILITFLPSLIYFTYSCIPPSYLKFIFISLDCLLSIKSILTPVLRKASSLSLFSITLKLNSILLKISFVGKKVILVPVKNFFSFFIDSPTTFNCFVTIC